MMRDVHANRRSIVKAPERQRDRYPVILIEESPALCVSVLDTEEEVAAFVGELEDILDRFTAWDAAGEPFNLLGMLQGRDPRDAKAASRYAASFDRQKDLAESDEWSAWDALRAFAAARRFVLDTNLSLAEAARKLV